jgi:ATP-binding cassette subfamily C (CFTR/MRP) protein 1
MSTYVTARQKIWLEAIQRRVNFTSEVLGSMKSVKMLGLADKMERILQGMRVREVELSKKFRYLSIANICLSE